MQRNYLKREILIFFNQFLLVAFLCGMSSGGALLPGAHALHFTLLTALFWNAYSIVDRNARGNAVLSQFAALMVLFSWHFLLGLFDAHQAVWALSVFLLPFCFFQLVNFAQAFLFQGSAYRGKKAFLAALRLLCLACAIAFFLDSRTFFLLYYAQLSFSLVGCIFLSAAHRKRIWFVLRSQKKQLLSSALFVLLPFSGYAALFFKQESRVEQLGLYLIAILAFVSIYRIFFRAVPREENIAVPGRRTAAVFFLLCILSLSLAAWIARLPVLTVFLVVHLIVLWILLYRLILCFDASRSQGSIPPQKKPSDFYEGVLTSIRREEALRQDFSNYLHDEILQDLLSMKNLIRKASQPDVGRLLEETLQKLTASIRSQMQFYHPAFSNALTFRENLQAALDSIQRESGTVLSLYCADTVFLIEPYAMPVCRIAKELVQNALKHAHASQVIVKLQQENDEVFLQVKDDGIGLFASTDDLRAHRGLASVREQVGLLQGSISIRAVPKKGTNISITIPMKGEESYAHFIGR